ncbi:MAG: hypothetical protein L0H84_12950 [Pseudonocardia sp.]|nr:hypothetical protein [Pseudonocardia sp.]
MNEQADDHQWRAEFRAFVRTHHPDRGGDPGVFVAGMARLARTRPASVPATATQDDLDPRYDRPVEFTTPYPLPLRVAIALIRTVRRQRAGRTVS